MTISSGLVAAYNKQAYGSSWVDLTNNGNGIALTNTSWETDGLQANASGEYGTFDNANSIINCYGGTIVVQLKSLSIVTDNTKRYIFGTRSTTIGDFYLAKLNDNILYLIFHDGVENHYIGINAGLLPGWQEGIFIAIQWDINNTIYDSKNIAFNINGVYVVPSISGVATSWTIFAVKQYLGVLNDYAYTTRYANGIMEYMYIFNTVKTASELAAIHANHSIILSDYRKKLSGYSLPVFYR
jgi:hypothetical protein